MQDKPIQQRTTEVELKKPILFSGEFEAKNVSNLLKMVQGVL